VVLLLLNHLKYYDMLRESKGNMYTWVTHEWNPVGGTCLHNCSYCYVGRWGDKPPLSFREKYLNDDLGNGRTIFVVSGGDLFAEDVPESWILRVLEHCRKYDNEYLFQTKNPQRIHYFWQWFPKFSVFCTTIETNRVYPQMGNTPSPQVRAEAMSRIDGRKFVTIEPIMDFDIDDLLDLISGCEPIQVNVGADSGHCNLPEPSKEKVLALIDGLQKFTKIDQKRNLNRLLC
jgi:DNA repair photolyase